MSNSGKHITPIDFSITNIQPSNPDNNHNDWVHIQSMVFEIPNGKSINQIENFLTEKIGFGNIHFKLNVSSSVKDDYDLIHSIGITPFVLTEVDNVKWPFQYLSTDGSMLFVHDHNKNASLFKRAIT